MNTKTILGCFKCRNAVSVEIDEFYNKKLPEGWVVRNLSNDKDMTPGYYVVCKECIKKEKNNDKKFDEMDNRIIEDVVIVNSDIYMFKFLCPICKKIEDNKEYLRFYIENDPNPYCVHSECILKIL